MSFQDRLAAAKAAPKPSEVVEVVMNSDLDSRIEKLEARLGEVKADAEADPRLSAADPTLAIQAEIDELLDSAPLERVRVYKMDSDAWGELVSLHPPRKNVAADVSFGFNTFAIAKPAAKRCAFVLDGDEDDNEISLTAEEWDDFFKVTPRLPSQIANAVFVLNVWEPAQAVERAKKASARRVASAQKSSSQPA